MRCGRVHRAVEDLPRCAVPVVNDRVEIVVSGDLRRPPAFVAVAEPVEARADLKAASRSRCRRLADDARPVLDLGPVVLRACVDTDAVDAAVDHDQIAGLARLSLRAVVHVLIVVRGDILQVIRCISDK